MKRIIIFLSIIIAFCSSLQSQSIQIYANNGINISNFIDLDYIATGNNYASRKISYRYGVGIQYNISKKWSIAIECNKEEKGWLEKKAYVYVTSSPLLLVPGQKNFVYSYVALPVIVSYQKQFKKYGYFFESGISSSKLLVNQSRIKTKPVGSNGNVANLFSPKAGTPYDFSGIAGVSVTRALNSKYNLFFNIRYSLSFTKMGSWGIQECCLRHQNFSSLIGISGSAKKVMLKTNYNKQ